MSTFRIIILFFTSYSLWIDAVPPEACFANFKWEDCGRPPVPVLYYWKPGSRCEVGLWRGCLPNLNMFQDEYECVATCIFSARAGDDDYHRVNELEETEPNFDITTTTSADNVTATGGTDGNVTSGTGATEAVATKGADSNSTSATGVTGATGATNAGTTVA